MLNSTKDRAESLALLTPRLEINKKCQDRDFQLWLQARLQVQAGEKILDLACGNGAQSKFFDRRLGPGGYLLCVDIHEPSINSLMMEIPPGPTRKFVVADMMDFNAYLGADMLFTLAHCSFALPYATNPQQVIRALAGHLQKPLGRIAVALPCTPHGMFDFIKEIHKVPESVEPAIKLGESVCIDIFRDLFAEVDVSYLNSNLLFRDPEDFMRLYRSSTYYSSTYDEEVKGILAERIAKHGSVVFKKSAILIIGRDPRQ